MGQGTESCGGYEVCADECEDGLEDGVWTQRDGSTIRVGSMSDRHIKNTIRLCHGLARSASFTSEAEKWEAWIDVLEQELGRRGPAAPAKPKRTQPAAPQRGAKARMICHCGKHYEAREADLKRGWGLSCGKRCAAIRRDFGRPAAKREK